MTIQLTMDENGSVGIGEVSHASEHSNALTIKCGNQVYVYEAKGAWTVTPVDPSDYPILHIDVSGPMETPDALLHIKASAKLPNDDMETLAAELDKAYVEKLNLAAHIRKLEADLASIKERLERWEG
jgi:hypothetical protein